MSLSLFYRELGGSGKPPLLLLHGLLGSSRNWQTAGTGLAEDYQVFALDLRNHGKSPHVEEMTYPSMVDDVLTWMDFHGMPRATVMGHSMGGKVAMLLACRHSARVERLIVVDIAPKDYRSAAHRGEFAAMNELDLDALQSRSEAELRFEARVPEWGMRKFLTTNLERTADGRWRWAVNLPVLTKSLGDLEKNSLTEADRFEGPTEFISGEQSSYGVGDAWEAIVSHFPRARLTQIKGVGHNPHIEAREAFVRAVLTK